jgi:isoleucyl-tRNA synthetase
MMPGSRRLSESVHLELFPDFSQTYLEERRFEEWEALGRIREAVLKELEMARDKKLIGNSLEALVTISSSGSDADVLEQYRAALPSLFIVSGVELNRSGEGELEVAVERVSWEKCQRCWNYSSFVGTSESYPEFCRRCADVVTETMP